MSIPNARVPVLDEDGSLTLPWRLWAQNLGGSDSSGSVTPADFAALVALVAILEAQLSTALAEAAAAQTQAQAAQLLALVSLSDAPDSGESFIELEV